MDLCRICLEEEPQTWITPCLCRGTQKHVHPECLEQWRIRNVNNGFYRCNTCHFEYRLSRVWWGKFIGNPVTSIITSFVGLGCLGYCLGYTSSSLYNYVYYWIRQLPYHIPHKYQTIFHGFAWIGFPGLLLFGSDIYGDIINVNTPNVYQRLPQINYHYHNNNNNNINNNEIEENKEEIDEKENKEDEEKETKPISPYENKSSILWIMLGFGSMYSYYYTYRWTYRKCLLLAARARTIIENVN